MIEQGSRGDRTDYRGGVGSRTTLGRGRGPDLSAIAVAEIRALLQRMIALPGRPQTRHAMQEELAIRWVLSGVPPVSTRAQIHHLRALRRRFNRTGMLLGWKNRYTLAIAWALREANHGCRS